MESDFAESFLPPLCDCIADNNSEITGDGSECKNIGYTGNNLSQPFEQIVADPNLSGALEATKLKFQRKKRRLDCDDSIPYVCNDNSNEYGVLPEPLRKLLMKLLSAQSHPRDKKRFINHVKSSGGKFKASDEHLELMYTQFQLLSRQCREPSFQKKQSNSSSNYQIKKKMKQRESQILTVLMHRNIENMVLSWPHTQESQSNLSANKSTTSSCNRQSLGLPVQLPKIPVSFTDSTEYVVHVMTLLCEELRAEIEQNLTKLATSTSMRQQSSQLIMCSEMNYVDNCIHMRLTPNSLTRQSSPNFNWKDAYRPGDVIQIMLPYDSSTGQTVLAIVMPRNRSESCTSVRVAVSAQESPFSRCVDANSTTSTLVYVRPLGVNLITCQRIESCCHAMKSFPPFMSKWLGMKHSKHIKFDIEGNQVESEPSPDLDTVYKASSVEFKVTPSGVSYKQILDRVLLDSATDCRERVEQCNRDQLCSLLICLQPLLSCIQNQYESECRQRLTMLSAFADTTKVAVSVADNQSSRVDRIDYNTAIVVSDDEEFDLIKDSDEYEDEDEDNYDIAEAELPAPDRIQPVGSLQLVQGPPGCGKTFFLVTLMGVLLQLDSRLVVTASSNKAVVVALEQLLSIKSVQNSKRIVLIGVQESIELMSSKCVAEDRYTSCFEFGNNIYSRNSGSASSTTLNQREEIASQVDSIISPRSPMEAFVYTLNDRIKTFVQTVIGFCSEFIMKPMALSKSTDNKQNLVEETTWNVQYLLIQFGRMYSFMNKFLPNYSDKSNCRSCFHEFNRNILGIRLQLLEFICQEPSSRVLNIRDLMLLTEPLQTALSKLGDENLARLLIKDCIETADAVFCTLAMLGQTLIQAALHRRVDYILVDEAAQSLECEMLTALSLNPRNMILVGDPKQLPAVTFSVDNVKAGLVISPMQRLIEICKHPYSILKTQYRMHEDIVAFPNRIFYGDQLTTASSVFARGSLLDDMAANAMKMSAHVRFIVNKYLKSYSFFDCGSCSSSYNRSGEGLSGKSQERGGSGSRSFSNPIEALCILRLVDFMKARMNVNASSQIGIITFYSDQVLYLRQLFAKKGYPLKDTPRIFTVDSYQGSESDIIIISFVRSNNAGRVGFIKDFQRLNVALTRAKRLLLCIGDVTTLLGEKARLGRVGVVGSSGNVSRKRHIENGSFSPDLNDVHRNDDASQNSLRLCSSADLVKKASGYANYCTSSSYLVDEERYSLHSLVIDAMNRNVLFRWDDISCLF